MNQEITEKTFKEILEEARIRLLKSDLKTIKTGEEFESLLFGVIKDICLDRKITDFERLGKHSFPDIRIGSFGIEAKFTVGDSWVTTGNSIMESTKSDDFKLIYIFFCKQGKKSPPDIMFRLYEECLSEIVVTHSPRYKINMELLRGTTIFEKMSTDYASFCKGDPIEKAKNHYRKSVKKGEEFWWIDKGVPPIIRTFSELNKETRESYKVEAMILFPEIFSRSSRKYDGPTLHLFQKHQAKSSSLRDIFTSGGQVEIKINEKKTVKVPKIFFQLYDHAKDIKESFLTVDREELSRTWDVTIKETDDIEKIWLQLVEEKSGLKTGVVSLIYRAGLRA